MAPTESQILTQTLLPPSSLSTILPLKTFTSLFPASQRSSAQIPVLYRALQLQRGLDLDAIRENIAAETRRGREQLRALARTRAKDARSLGTGEGLGDEGEGFADSTGGVLLNVGGRRGVHDSKSLCESMEDAEADLIAEIAALDLEARALIEDCEGIVDELGGLEMNPHSTDTTIGGLDTSALLRDLLALQGRAEAEIGDRRAKARMT